MTSPRQQQLTLCVIKRMELPVVTWVCLCARRAGRLIPKNEVMVVLDADMVAEHDFFVR